MQLSPAMWVVNKAYDQVYKFLTEFGLSPASRSKVTANKVDASAEDPFDRLANNGS